MTRAVFEGAVRALREAGWVVDRLVLPVGSARELLKQANWALVGEAGEGAVEGQTVSVGVVDGVLVVGQVRPNAWKFFDVWRGGERDARFLGEGAAGEWHWVMPDPVRLAREWFRERGWAIEWVRVWRGYGEAVRERQGLEGSGDWEGVKVWVGGVGPQTVMCGGSGYVQVFEMTVDGVGASELMGMKEGAEALEGRLRDAREHVRWGGHGGLKGRMLVGRDAEGWHHTLVCGVCGWSVRLSELVVGAAQRWELLNGLGLSREVALLSGETVRERPDDWSRLDEGVTDALEGDE